MKKSPFRKRGFSRAIIFIALIALLSSVVPLITQASPNNQESPIDVSAPYQAKMLAEIEARRDAGLPVPDVTTSTAYFPGNTVAVTTTIAYSGPEEAGYDVWPALESGNFLPDGWNGTEFTGDLTEVYREAVESTHPGIWDTYTFGYEPRTITFTERITAPTQAAIEDFVRNATGLSRSEDILMGFSVIGPDWNYTIDFELVLPVPIPFVDDIVIVSFKAGIELSWAAGIRLPARVSLTAPDVVEVGGSTPFETILTGTDWDAADYATYNVAEEAGNEIVFRLNFFLGAEIIFLPGLDISIGGFDTPIDLCPSCNIQGAIDESSSITTPLGPGGAPIFPTLDITLLSIPLPNAAVTFAEIRAGIAVTPLISTDDISAVWSDVNGTATGIVSYDTSGETETFIVDGVCSNEDLTIQLSDFRYNLNDLIIDMDVFFEFEVLPIDLIVIEYDGDTWRADISLLEITANNVLDGLYLGDYIEYETLNIDITNGFDFDDVFFQVPDAGPDNVIEVGPIPVIDAAGPATSIALDGAFNPGGFFESEVTVSLDAIDNPIGCGSGVASTEYSLDGNTWQTYLDPFVISDEGLTTIFYRSTDNEGNVEDTKQQDVIISLPRNRCDISGFELWNADTDSLISPLHDSAIVNLEVIGDARLTIVAVTEPSSVGSVTLTLLGARAYADYENYEPYSIFGDDRFGDIYGEHLPVGDYTIMASAHTEAYQDGEVCAEATINFTVIDTRTPPVTEEPASTPEPGATQEPDATQEPGDNNPAPDNPTNNPAPETPAAIVEITGFLLVNADTDTVIGSLSNGATIDTDAIGTRNLNIVAETNGAASVIFFGSFSRNENAAPFSAGGDNEAGDYLPISMDDGNYTVNAVAYSEVYGNGTASAPASVSFTVIGS